ncbi:hypothetical protein SRHO_G00309350 [Serrasalmus rhombeus]
MIQDAKGSSWKGNHPGLVSPDIFVVIVACWFPFFFTYNLMALCSSPCSSGSSCYRHSSHNSIIYIIFNIFARTFQKILRQNGWQEGHVMCTLLCKGFLRGCSLISNLQDSPPIQISHACYS